MKITNRVPERIIQRINRATASIIENGLANFYKSLADSLENRVFNSFNTRIGFGFKEMQDDDVVIALTIDQLKVPMIINSILLALASVLLVIEIIVYRVNKWRNRRQTSIQRTEDQPKV